MQPRRACRRGGPWRAPRGPPGGIATDEGGPGAVGPNGRPGGAAPRREAPTRDARRRWWMYHAPGTALAACRAVGCAGTAPGAPRRKMIAAGARGRCARSPPGGPSQRDRPAPQQLPAPSRRPRRTALVLDTPRRRRRGEPARGAAFAAGTAAKKLAARWRLGAVAAAAAAAAAATRAAAQTPVWSVIPTVGSSPTSMEVPPPGCVCVDETR